MEDYITSTPTNTRKETPWRKAFKKEFLSTKLGFNVSTPLEDQAKTRNKGQLSRVELGLPFRGFIDLDDYYNFFPVELDSEESDKDNTAVTEFIDRAIKVLLENKENRIGTKEDVTIAYHASRVEYFLSLEEKTVDSFVSMLQDVYKYVSNNKIAEGPRRYLKSVFEDEEEY